tara:strand:- start:291 stop:1085 length:795 start_codon:yes stop_codon:yes gene_type:complete
MKKKFAVCFSGYPRWVRKSFDTIKSNILDGLGEYDIYANFQWNEDNWKGQQIHHEYHDVFEVNELEEFKELYGSLNLKKLNVIKPYSFGNLLDNVKGSIPDLQLNLEQSKDCFYRMKSQCQGMYDVTKLIDNLEDYEYVIRMRTDLVTFAELDLINYESEFPMNQDGFVAGADRFWCDWFFIIPTSKIDFLKDLSHGPLENGIVIHIHDFVGKCGKKYNIEHEEFYIRTPTALGPNNLTVNDVGTYRFKKPILQSSNPYVIIDR